MSKFQLRVLKIFEILDDNRVFYFYMKKKRLDWDHNQLNTKIHSFRF